MFTKGVTGLFLIVRRAGCLPERDGPVRTWAQSYRVLIIRLASLACSRDLFLSPCSYETAVEVGSIIINLFSRWSLP